MRRPQDRESTAAAGAHQLLLERRLQVGDLGAGLGDLLNAVLQAVDRRTQLLQARGCSLDAQSPGAHTHGPLHTHTITAKGQAGARRRNSKLGDCRDAPALRTLLLRASSSLYRLMSSR
jgi:hypothetical protein